MSRMCTLHELAVKFAKKQPGMVDALTEDAPVLNHISWKQASHGLWHNAEILTDIEGPGFIEFDAPIPVMSTSSDLVRTDLHMLAGGMEVPTQRALKFGGPQKYFADKQDVILREAGMKTEVKLVMDNWLSAAQYVNKHKTEAAAGLRNAGGKGPGWFLLAVRMEEQYNCGLFDPGQFEQGRLFKISFPYNGAEHHLKGKNYEGVLGYSIVYRANFGWLLLPQMAHRCCSAIVNIDEDNLPTPAMIDDMLSEIRAQSGKTFIFCSPKAKTHAINPHKRDVVQMTQAEKDIKTHVDSWNGIPIITSYNIMNKIQNVKVV